MLMKYPRDYLPSALFTIFIVSGFSGLIYESVWTHYLKLFLGHAAYAQTLVLSIFMGGLAIGSWLASRWSTRWASPLLAYAIIEGLIGLGGLGFHKAFTLLTALSFENVIPWLGGSSAIQVYKWSLSAIVILPQTILLGMTFPLMSVGLIRHRPATPGAHVSMLYFTNSIGAAAGVLASGFLLIPNVGLPGAMMTAGLLNVFVALATWLISRRLEHVPSLSGSSEGKERAEGSQSGYALLLLAAFITGLASFLYEIGWIRMLTLVLGSSTHAFELMLSAFILGLAFGGLWIRRRIDRLADSLKTLGIVQVVMALLALSTLFAYGRTFDLMGQAMGMFARSDAGYFGFNAISQMIAILVMVPTTFCAGMTLPLLTYTALRRGVGERAVGGIYAANTVGAILGVAAAVHLAMPIVGTKGVIIAGAAFDFALGLWLLAVVPGRKTLTVAVALGLIGFGLSLTVAHFDPQKMTSGVFRTGQARFDDVDVLFHRDGKTATVSLTREGTTVKLATNGKIDAGMNTDPEGEPALDELTQNMAGALPLSLHPRAKTAAVVGIGSGMTSAILLAHPQLTRVETIEIEPLMVEGARMGMMPRNRAVFEDPRSVIHIEDAKTFLSTHGRRYDIIVSEPSNPWVSGVATLFSEEFYRHTVRHLEDEGILAQWIQLYEINLPLVASIVRAMSGVFEDYAVYNIDSSNILIVAKKSGKLEGPGAHIFESLRMRTELARVGIQEVADMTERRIGGKRLLDPMFAALGVPVNSDFFPFVDVNAVRARYMKENARDFAVLSLSNLPVQEMLDGEALPTYGKAVGREKYDTALLKARLVREALLAGSPGILPASASQDPAMLLYAAASCPGLRLGRDWEAALLQVMGPLAGRLDAQALAPVWDRLLPPLCQVQLTPDQRRLVSLLKAVSARDATQMVAEAEALLSSDKATDDRQTQYLIGAFLLGKIALGQSEDAVRFIERNGQVFGRIARHSLQLQWLQAIALERSRKNQLLRAPGARK
jgi:predicted membrane-bound spermidine synthase